ncbi:hypothetical protein KY285_007648 [Solanum tuberosum]|nr:hypothetical protein KY285_007648 [Solanum tuberosum]
MSKTDKENRKKLSHPHTVGKTSFAIICEAEMETIETQETEDGSQSVDAYAAVMAPDHPGRRKIEELEERIQQRMQEKFNAQKDNMERDVTMNIIAQLQRLNPGLALDPSMLRFSVHSPGEEAAIQLINHSSAGSSHQGFA